jgi:hypothetical protein
LLRTEVSTYIGKYEVVPPSLTSGWYNYLIVLVRGVDRVCGLVLRVPGYRSSGPGSIPGATRFYEK